MKNKNDILREASLTLSILLLTSWAAHGEGSLHILTSFETKEETELLMPGNREYEVQVEWREESASHGKGSALLSYPPYKEEPEERKHLYWARCALTLGKTESTITDWSDYRRVEVDVYNPTTEQLELGIGFYDAGDGSNAGHGYWEMPPESWTTIYCDTARLAAEMDCSRVHQITFWSRLQIRGSKDRTDFYVDSIRLLPKELTQESVRIDILVPHFRGAFHASSPAGRVEARVEVDFPSWARKHRVEAVLLDGDKPIAEAQTLATTADPQIITFQLANPPSAAEASNLTLCVTATDPEGEEVLTINRDLPVREAAPDEVTIDEQNRMLVNGRPIFPISIYNPSLGDLDVLARMGFNCAGPVYHRADAEFRAEALKHGLRLIANWRDLIWDRKTGKERPTDPEEVREFSESGAILGYYIYDEPPPQQAADFRRECRRFADLDPYHPTFGCNNYIRQYPHYTDAADVMMVNMYCFRGEEYDMNGILGRVGTALEVMADRRPVWFIPQSFNNSAYEPTEADREPSYNHVRGAAWMGIVLGVRGICYYTANIQTFPVRTAYPNLWRAVGYTVQELRGLEEILLWDMEKVETNTEHVHAAVFRNGKRGLLAVVNAGKKPAEVSVEVPADGTFQVVGENRQVRSTDGTLKNHFAPQTAHLYANWEIEAPVDVLAAEERLAGLRAERERRLENNLALCWKGAMLTASSGFLVADSEEERNKSPTQPLRMIDGYRGSNWKLGLPGRFKWVPELWGSNRWFQVTFPEEEDLDEAVVVMGDVNYQFAVFQDDEWRVVEPAAEELYTDHLAETESFEEPWFQLEDQEFERAESKMMRTFSLQGVRSDRVRVLMPDPARGPELYYNIEVYRAGQEPGTQK